MSIPLGWFRDVLVPICASFAGWLLSNLHFYNKNIGLNNKITRLGHLPSVPNNPKIGFCYAYRYC